jgi:transposase
VNRRFEITDQEWERLAPLLPATTPQRGGRWRDHRQVLNGILFRVRTGIPWRDLPQRYGPWETVYKSTGSPACPPGLNHKLRRWHGTAAAARELATDRTS